MFIQNNGTKLHGIISQQIVLICLMKLNGDPLKYAGMTTQLGGLAVSDSHLSVTLDPCLLVKLNDQACPTMLATI